MYKENIGVTKSVQLWLPNEASVQPLMFLYCSCHHHLNYLQDPEPILVDLLSTPSADIPDAILHTSL